MNLAITNVTGVITTIISVIGMLFISMNISVKMIVISPEKS